MMPAFRIAVIGCGLWFAAVAAAADHDNALVLPEVGSSQLRTLTPTILELTLITTKTANSTRLTQWDFADFAGHLRLPSVNKLQVVADGQLVPIHAIGFRRRVVYAPLPKRDLRISNYLYSELPAQILVGQ